MTASPRASRAWFMLMLPAVLLLVLSSAVAVYYGVQSRGDPAAIQRGVVRSISVIIAVNHTLVFLMLLWFLRRDGWSLATIGFGRPGAAKAKPGEAGRSTAKAIAIETAIGVAVGVGGHVLLRHGLEPAFDLIRGALAGATGRDVGGPSGMALPSAPVLFLVVAAVFPIVEEAVYRGYAITHLRRRMPVAWAIVISSAFFGLLHWGEGVWALPLTAVLGAYLAVIFVWRRNLWAATIGHSLINIIGLALAMKG